MKNQYLKSRLVTLCLTLIAITLALVIIGTSPDGLNAADVKDAKAVSQSEAEELLDEAEECQKAGRDIKAFQNASHAWGKIGIRSSRSWDSKDKEIQERAVKIMRESSVKLNEMNRGPLSSSLCLIY